MLIKCVIIVENGLYYKHVIAEILSYLCRKGNPYAYENRTAWFRPSVCGYPFAG